jgi:RNA polymerase sigma factor (sigma-70 family)
MNTASLGTELSAGRGVSAAVRGLTTKQFSDLYREQFPALTKFLTHGYLSRPEAEDVAQEAFLVLIPKLAAGAPIRYIRAYLFTIARHLALRYINQHNGEVPLDLLPDTIDYAAVDSVAAIEDQPSVQQALRILPVAQRDTFELIYLGLSAEEISKVLGVSPATVRSNLRHARQILRKVTVPGSSSSEDST